MTEVTRRCDATHRRVWPSLRTMRHDGELMGDDAHERAERSASMAWTSAVLESFGRGLVCLDSDFRILFVSSLAARLLDAERPPRLLSSAESLLGTSLFGPDGLLREALAHDRRGRATLRRDEGPLLVSAAALQDDSDETGVSYAVLVSTAGADERWNVRLPVDVDAGELLIRGRSADRDELRAVLDHYHWQRAEAARALGISRTTLWRKMREVGLI